MAMSRAVIANGVLEVVQILYREYGDENFQLAPAILGGLVVGACTIVGGLLGGRYGLVIGKYLFVNTFSFTFLIDIVLKA